MASEMILFEQKPKSFDGSWEDVISIRSTRSRVSYLVMECVVLQQVLTYPLVASSNLPFGLRSVGEPKVRADLGLHSIFDSGASITASSFNLFEYISMEVNSVIKMANSPAL